MTVAESDEARVSITSSAAAATPVVAVPELLGASFRTARPMENKGSPALLCGGEGISHCVLRNVFECMREK